MTPPIPKALTVAVASLALLATAGATYVVSTAQRPVGTPACQSPAKVMLRVELVFGLSRQGQPDIDDAAWRQFLASEITPRFPDGLTVVSAHGQWRNAGGAIITEPARMLLIWAPPTDDLGPRLDAIRTAWKRAHRQESVIRAESPACLSF